MRCPVCSRYANNCVCTAAEWGREVRASFQAFARHQSEAAAPAERTACPVAVDDRTQATSGASEPPTRDGADKPVEGEGR
jgi:hypothetical protein